MPAKNVIKNYQENSYYHLYNRGVEKRNIFTDEKDYKVFLSYLKIYLSPKDTKRSILLEAKNWKEKDVIIRLLNLKNYCESIDLLAYCLMPNHFHFLIKQNPAMAIKSFMHSLCTKYSMYFNRQYDRVGTLFQGNYKAVQVKSEEQLVYLSKYIHFNPGKEKMYDWKYSSLPNYSGTINQVWLKPTEIISLFSKDQPNSTYLKFMAEKQDLCLEGLKLDD